MAGVTRNLIVAITSQSGPAFSKGFKDAQRQVDSFGRSIDQAGRGSVSQFNGRVSALSASLTGLATVAAAGFGAAKIVGFAKESIAAFSNLEESINAINVTFDEGADQILQFGRNAATSVGLSQAALNQAVVPIGALFRNFGFSADEAADSAIQLTQRAADLASVFNTEVEDALGAIGSALRGEQEPLRRFGADISAARVEAFLLSEGIVSNKNEIDEAAKVWGRYQLVLQDTARAQGDFANTSDSFANQQRILAARFEEVKASIGERLIPFAQQFLEIANDSIPVVEELGGQLVELGQFAAEAASGFIDIKNNIDDFGESVGIDSLALKLGELLLLIGLVKKAIPGLGAAINLPAAAASAVLAPIGIASGEAIASGFRETSEAAQAAYDASRGYTEQFGRLVREISAFQGVSEEVAVERARIEMQFIEQAQAAARAPLSFEESIKGQADVIGGFQEATEAVEETTSAFDEFYGVLEGAAGPTDEAVESAKKLAEEFAKTIDIFSEAPEEIDASLSELLSNVQQRTAQFERFSSALATLSAAGLDALVNELVQQGPSVTGVAEDLAGDIATAFEIDQELRDATQAATEAAEAALLGQEPALARAFNDLGMNLADAFELGFSNVDLASSIVSAITRAERQGSASGITRTPAGSSSRLGGIEFRASGGPVLAGRDYIVGERGPELFVPNTAGTIYPSVAKGTSSQNVTINVTSPQPVIEQDIQRAVLLSGIARRAEVARI